MEVYCYKIWLLLICSVSIYGMEDQGVQLEFCPTRQEYIKAVIANGQSSAPICFFCDEDSLKKNFILYYNEEEGLMVIMNKNPYPDFSQAMQLLVIPIAHKVHPADFSKKDIEQQVKVLRWLHEKLNNESFSIENFINWGRPAGQSVDHWHIQCKFYTKKPISMPERMSSFKDYPLQNVEEAFKVVKELLTASTQSKSFVSFEEPGLYQGCLCCKVNGKNNDQDGPNFVVRRFSHNYVCLAHNPRIPGEIVVVPYRHVATFNDLLPYELTENMVLAMGLLDIMKEYAHANIRECGGVNLYARCMGNKIPFDEKNKFHASTSVLPRTTIVATPGMLGGNSRKLDYNPTHLFAYLKEKI